MSKSWKIELLLLPWVDALAWGGAFFLAFWLRPDIDLINHFSEKDASYYLIFLLSLPVFWIFFFVCHLYDLQEIFYGSAEYVRIIRGVSFTVLGVIAISFLVNSRPLARTWLLLFWILGILLIGLARFTFRRLIRPLFRSGRWSERTLVVGASEEAMSIVKTLKETGRLEIVGFLDDFSPIGEKVSGDLIVKGVPEDYKRIAQEEGVSKLILVPGAVSWETYREILFEASAGNGLDILIAPRLSGLFSGTLRLSYIGYIPMLRFQAGYTGRLNRLGKTAPPRELPKEG